MDYVLITTNNDLAEVCARAQRYQAVALDTEFVRTRTLTPKLGLIQLYDGHQLVLIDPLTISDFRPFVHLLENPEVTKVLHSCSEDLETFLSFFGVLPAPVFDTQFAASILGLGATLGYAKLVEELCGESLDKGESRTDWLARPLRESQLVYAANDVLYLLPAYEQLNNMIIDRGKRQWVLDEVAQLGVKKQASMPVEYAYIGIKNNWRLNSEQLYVLKALAGWRLAKAREKDLALNFVFKEIHLFEVAQKLPESRSALSKVEGISPPAFRRYSEVITELVRTARAEYASLDEAARPAVIKRLIDVPAYKKTLAELKHATNQIAIEQGVSPEVLASKKQLNQLLKWRWFDMCETRAQGLKPDLLVGWRAPLFAPAVTRILGESEND